MFLAGEWLDVIFDYRVADGQPERDRELVADLVRSGADVIVTLYDRETLIAKRVTTSIPIIILAGVDPIGSGLVTSLVRPGGNITGLTFDAGPELAGKRLEPLKEAIPKLRSVAFLFKAEVKRASLPGWRPARPLLALEAGDAVRTSRDAAVVILLSHSAG